MPALRRLLFTSFALATAALAQDQNDHLAMGKMWTFENPPLAYLEQEYGFKPDQRWLDSLRLSALRLGERDNPWCSASFVSPRGLIMTNHHCVRDNVAKLGAATGNPGLVDEGFAAKALADEVKLDDLTVQQLIEQTDVTAQVNDGVAPGDDDVAAGKKRAANVDKITQAAKAAHPDRMHQVVALYQGAVHQLYAYKVYDDVRLVMAVNLQSAHFGGDPDNFTFPRWSIDFAFVRAYADGTPADTSAHYFRFRQQGAKDGELVFVPGNPGDTDRLLTQEQLQTQRDVELPITLEQWQDEMAAVRPFARRIPQLMTMLLGIENSYKAVSGQLAGLRDAGLMAKKAAHEQRFREAVRGNAEWQQAYGDVWDKIAELTKAERATLPRTAYYAAGYSPHLDIALAVVKAVDAALPEGERAAAREAALGADTETNPLIAALIPTQFERMRRCLPADDPVVAAVLGDGGIKDAVRKLGGSLVNDRQKVQELLDGGADAVGKSEDFAIQVARVLWPQQRDNDRRTAEIRSGLEAQGARIGKALHAVYGSKVSPDATMTLRFSDGKVAGYSYNGTRAPWATSFYGLYGRSHEFGGEHPFDLPAPWVAAADKIDLARKVCFVSTNDIVGGNSGSCVVDRELQVVGLIFDGNIESLSNTTYYTQDRARAVSVHTDAILEALTKVYDLARLADELLAGRAR